MAQPAVTPAPPDGVAPPRPGVLELLLALAVAVACIVMVALLTNQVDARGWNLDEKIYLSMAMDGPLKAKPRVAPFLYRPGTTWVAGGVAKVLKVPPERAFRLIAWGALPLCLFLLYVLARRYTASWRRALLAMLLVGVSFSATKRLLFNPISPDALGLLLVTVAALLLASGRYWWLTAVTALGVACREFVVIPAVVGALGAVRRPAQPPGRLARVAPFAAAVVVGVLVRALIPVATSTQTIDPQIPKSWSAIVVALEPCWVTNVIGASITFLLPLACVWRRRDAAAATATLPAWVPLYGLVLLVIMTFAGMNFIWFAAFYAPALAVAYAVKAKDEPLPLQLALLVMMAGLSRLLELIPHPLRESQEYVGFTAFYSHRIDGHTGRRAVQMLAIFVCYRGLRALWDELAAARAPAAPGGGGAPPAAGPPPGASPAAGLPAAAGGTPAA